MTAQADPDLTRLIKLCGLLGSAQVGERAAAALKVTEWLQTRGLVWEDVLGQEETLPAVSVSVGNAAPTTAAMLEQERKAAFDRGYRLGHQDGSAFANPAHAEVQKAYAAGFADGARASRPGPQPVGQNAYGSGAFSTGRTWRDALADAYMHVDQIRASGRTKEAGFLDDLSVRKINSLSPKQELWLRDICLRLGVEQW